MTAYPIKENCFLQTKKYMSCVDPYWQEGGTTTTQLDAKFESRDKWFY